MQCKLKWIKGYTSNGRRLYKCVCKIEVVAYDKKEAQAIHNRVKNATEETKNN